jgi:hypothetical protein
MSKDRPETTAFLSLSSAFPPTYLEFMSRYGGVKLFREGLGYLLTVLPVPLREENDEHGVLFRFGSYDDSYCYFLEAIMMPNEESPVYAVVDGELIPVASSFGEWFTLAATELLSQRHLTGDAAFTEKEKQILQLRKLYQWQVIGHTDKAVAISITNMSNSTLNCITLGIQSKDGTLNGAVKVDVSDLAPGRTKNINLDCYSDLIHPSCVNVFDLPDPTPGTRTAYFELTEHRRG